MPAPATVDEFLTLVRKSGLLEEQRLKGCLGDITSAAPLPQKTDEVAGLLVRAGLLTFFQANQLLRGRWRRFQIGGKYKLLELLGVGGMGAVYLCEHMFLHRLVALKVLPPEKLADPSAIDRFKREARASAALIHPNIVHTYDFDTFEKLHFLVLEFVDGSSLQEIVSRHGAVSIERATDYVYQTALGLQHAHVSGLVHRDVKPGNLLLDRQGTIKILDMGLARFFNSKRSIDNVTKLYDEKCVLGTADYLAPEQAMQTEVDIRADVYSLGCTWYYLLTGKSPFPDGSVAQKLLNHQNKEPKPVRALRPEVPVELAAILGKMMAKKPAQRYQSPIEVAEALEPFLVEVEPPPAKEMPRFSIAALSVGRVSETGPRTPQPASGRVRTALAGRGASLRGGSSLSLNGPGSSGQRAGTVETVTLPATDGGSSSVPLDGGRRMAQVARQPAIVAFAAAAGAVLALAAVAFLVWVLRPTP